MAGVESMVTEGSSRGRQHVPSGHGLPACRLELASRCLPVAVLAP